MRIIAGKWRGTRLAALGKGDELARLRPTPDRVRESLFSMLTHRDAIVGKRVLDLFAGTGALGLEALSRGADYALFVESGRVGQRLITANIAKLNAGECATLLATDATGLRQAPGDPFDLVCLDPPYGKDLGQRALAAADAGGWLADEALIVWEESAEMSAPPGFKSEETRRFGDTFLTILSKE